MTGPQITRRRLALGALALAASTRHGRAAASAPPSRIVTVGGAITECVFALGHGARVVATDTTSVFPAATQALQRIGYLRQIAPEGVVALGAAQVIASDEIGPPAALLALRGVGVDLRLVPDRPGRSGALEKIAAVAAALDAVPAGAALAAAVAQDFDAVAQAVATAGGPRPRALFLLATSRGAMLAAGRDTAADTALALAGAANVVDGYAGYKPLSPEAALVAAPDVVVTMSQTVDAAGSAEAILGLPALAATPAARRRRLVAIEGSWLLQFGPRAPHAIHALARALVPGRALAPLPERPWMSL